MDDLPALNPAYVDDLRNMVATAPFPSLIGMTLDELDLDRCSMGLTVSKHHLQPYEIVHGGVLATLIDSATFWSGFARLPDDTGLVNVDLKLNYLEAVTAATGRLVTQGRCLRPGRSINYCEAHVRDDHGRLVAHGTSTLMAVPGRPLPISTPKFLSP